MKIDYHLCAPRSKNEENRTIFDRFCHFKKSPISKGGVKNLTLITSPNNSPYFDARGLETDSRQVDCNEVLAELETINEDLDEIGIMLVTTTGTEVATENGKRFLWQWINRPVFN